MLNQSTKKGGNYVYFIFNDVCVWGYGIGKL